MNKRKLLFSFDLDGTLLNRENKIHDNIKEQMLIGKKKGHVFVTNSGRGYFQQLNVLKEADSLLDYIIGNNGSVIYDVKRNSFKYLFSLNSDVVLKIYESAKKFTPFVFLHTSEGVFIIRTFDGQNPPHWVLDIETKMKYFGVNWMNYEQGKQIILKTKVVQLNFTSTPEINELIVREILSQFNKEIDHYMTITFNVFSNIDIIGKGASKAVGLDNLAKTLKTPVENVISFGDGLNDLEVLQYSGYSYAMSNAPDEVKKLANEVIGDCDTDTIANIIKEYNENKR